MINNTHLTTEQVLDLLESRLDPAAREVVLEHLSSGCPVCTQNYENLDRIFQAISTTNWPAPSAQAHQRAVNAFEIQYPKKMRPQPQPSYFLRPVLAGFAVIAIVMVILFLTLPQQAVNAARLENVTGRVELKVDPNASWQVSSPGESVPIGALIRTSSDSQAVLKFPGGANITLGPDTQLELTVLTRKEAVWQIILNQTSGRTKVMSNVKNTLFRIQTIAGSTDTNGANFDLQIEENGTTVVNVNEGSVEANSPEGNLLISAGQTGLLSKNRAPTTGLPPSISTEPNGPPKSTAIPEENNQNNQSTESSPGLQETGNPEPLPTLLPSSIPNTPNAPAEGTTTPEGNNQNNQNNQSTPGSSDQQGTDGANDTGNGSQGLDGNNP
jgi:hypothetical protein